MQTEIGAYTVDAANQKVLKHGQPVKWGEKASRLFILLLQATPKTISKEDIFAEVWKGRVVTENTLYKAISKLRHELNQQDIEIESVFGEGYRLIQTIPQVEAQSTKTQMSFKLKQLVAGLLVLVICGGLWILWQYKHERNLIKAMTELEKVLAVNKQSFISQIARRNELGELLKQRFELRQEDSWEKRFFQLYDDMNEQERFLCQQVRAYTEGPLYENNQRALEILTANPDMQNHIEVTQELITHLTIWLNKYERVFVSSEKMCLLYVGVEDNAHYPSEFDGLLSEWLNERKH